MFPDLPSLLSIEANHSLDFINSHSSYGEVLPLLPHQVEVGCMHCRPAQPLPAVSYYTNLYKKSYLTFLSRLILRVKLRKNIIIVF